MRHVMDFKESTCYDYVECLRESGCSLSTAKTFLESLNFCQYLLGMPHIEFAASSARIRGACSKLLASKRPLQQAPPLTVDQVRALHRVVCRAPDARDRCKAGYDLFCVYACARHNDAMHPSKVVIDLDSQGYGCLELHTTRHKVATNDERRSLFLPLVALSPGLAKEPWSKAWLEAREETGFKFCEMPTSPATVLSWACKFGIDKDHRRILGHHLDPGETSALTYSRAAMDVPLELSLIHI